jgi:hypothetical protein
MSENVGASTSRNPKGLHGLHGDNFTLACLADYLGNPTRFTIMGGDLNLPFADWNGRVDCTNGGQASVNSLAWEHGYTQVVPNPTRGDALLDVYLVRPENLFTSYSIIQGVSDHRGVLLEVEWEEKYCRPQLKILAPVYHKADVIGLQTFLRQKICKYGQAMVDMLRIYGITKNIILQCIEMFVPHKISRTNSDPEYYNKEVKR